MAGAETLSGGSGSGVPAKEQNYPTAGGNRKQGHGARQFQTITKWIHEDFFYMLSTPPGRSDVEKSSRRRLHPDHKTDKTEEDCRITPVMPAPCASVGYGHGPRWSASKHQRQGDATNLSGPAQTPSTVDPVRTIEKAFPVFSSTLCRVGLAGSAPRDWLDAVMHTPHNSRTFFWGRRPTS